MRQTRVVQVMGAFVMAAALPLAHGCGSTPPPQPPPPATTITMPPLNVTDGKGTFASSECRDKLPAKTESMFVSDVSSIDDASRNLLQAPCVIEVFAMDSQGRSVVQQAAVGKFVTEEKAIAQFQAIVGPLPKPGHYKVRLVMGDPPNASPDFTLVVQ